jgi:hypothetical protein
MTEPVKIDFSKQVGAVKALHGINNSPITHGEELPEFTAAGIPFVRLHDACGAFGGTYFVDVPNVFPNFDADPDDPSSYDFAFTDAYLKGLIASGVKIFYRLGVTIENHHAVKAYRIHPPRDFEKWARICAGIIRHYNRGWAGGFHYGIEYWEIWNEPENPPMWTGTCEQYFELYRVAANHLKQQFPDIRVGGYGSCGFYAVNREGMSDFFKGFVPYFLDFLKFVTAPATAAPLDFFTWHIYTTDPREIAMHAEFVRRTLLEHGLAHVESICDEWNVTDWKSPDRYDAMKEMPGATFVAAAFCLMQKSPVNKAMYYDALPTREFCGLYYFPSQRVTKTYYAFKAFNELFRCGDAVACSSNEAQDIYVCAARGKDGQGAVLIVNRSTKEQHVPLDVTGIASRPTCRVLDNFRFLEEVECMDSMGIYLSPQSVVLLNYPSPEPAGVAHGGQPDSGRAEGCGGRGRRLP